MVRYDSSHYGQGAQATAAAGQSKMLHSIKFLAPDKRHFQGCGGMLSL